MMNDPDDGRVPIRLGQPQAGDIVLVEDGIGAPPGATLGSFRLAQRTPWHQPGCACCVPRTPVAEALNRLFLARARGEVAWFSAVAVVASSAGIEVLRAAMTEDRVVAARFRLIDD